MRSIEGTPDGFELLRLGSPLTGEWWGDEDGSIKEAKADAIAGLFYPVFRKTEKPVRYREFANGAEYEPHRDRWVEYISPNQEDYFVGRISAYSSQRVWIGANGTGIQYREAFHCLKFADGSPFGVEVTS